LFGVILSSNSRFTKSETLAEEVMGKCVQLRNILQVVVIAAVLASNPSADAQVGGAASSLSGTVADPSGALIPGADVRVKNAGTGTEYSTIMTENGTFTIPALPPGQTWSTNSAAARLAAQLIFRRS
jgi:hypothetical protein